MDSMVLQQNKTTTLSGSAQKSSDNARDFAHFGLGLR